MTLYAEELNRQQRHFKPCEKTTNVPPERNPYNFSVQQPHEAFEDTDEWSGLLAAVSLHRPMRLTVGRPHTNDLTTQ